MIDITQLTPTHIGCLIDDVEVSIERKPFEDWITDVTGRYIFYIQTPERSQEFALTLDEYWQDAIGSDAHARELSHYIEYRPLVQLQIKWASIDQYIRYELNEPTDDKLRILRTMVDEYALAFKHCDIVELMKERANGT